MLKPEFSAPRFLDDYPEAAEKYSKRPFDLYGASFWQSCYVSPQMEEVAGVLMPTMIGVESPHSWTNSFRSRDELADFRQALRSVVENEPEKCAELIKRAEQLSSDKDHLPPNLKDVHSFLVSAYIYQHIFPYFYLEFSGANRLKTLNEVKRFIAADDLARRAFDLRGGRIEVFHEVYEQQIPPLVIQKLKELGRHDPKAIGAITVNELLDGNISPVTDRLAEIDLGKFSVYATASGQERVSYTENPEELIDHLEGGGNLAPEHLREDW